ncbi:hypothetical protein D9M71_182720 [compost metagenome]
MDARRGTFWLVFLGAAAALALIPEYFFPEEEAAPAVQVAPRKPATLPLPEQAVQTAAAPRAGAASGAAPRAAGNPMQADLFPAQSWRKAPPPPSPAEMAARVPPPPPPPPMAPPLPFQFIGRMSDDRQARVFLQSGDRVYTVHPGDVIDDTYRVDRITATELTFTYLPLHQSQSLAVGSAP